MRAEKGGDNCTGRDAVDCTDEEPSKGSIRDCVLGRDEGYGAFVPVFMLDVLSTPSTCLARMNLGGFVTTEKILNFRLPVFGVEVQDQVRVVTNS